ncbi:MAG: chalcone isomerase family protein, partial [Rhodoferax sp.]
RADQNLVLVSLLYGKAIAERSIAEMRRSKDLPAALETRWLADMQSAFPDDKPQDRLTGVLMPEQGERFYFNGQVRATVSDPAFAKFFFGIWLADWTSEPKLRNELLAGTTP